MYIENTIEGASDAEYKIEKWVVTLQARRLLLKNQVQICVHELLTVPTPFHNMRLYDVRACMMQI